MCCGSLSTILEHEVHGGGSLDWVEGMFYE